MVVKVIEQKLRIPNNQKKIISGSRNFVKLCFYFSPDWDGLDKYAKFTQGDNDYDVNLDDDNTCYLPASITDGTCSIMLYGIGGSGSEVIGVTNSETITIDEAEYNPTGDDPDEVYSDDFVASLSETLGYLNIS